MVCIPYTKEQWTAIEEEFRKSRYPDKWDGRKKLPVREVAEWWALYSGSRVGAF
jgi:hypothetical protein